MSTHGRHSWVLLTLLLVPIPSLAQSDYHSTTAPNYLANPAPIPFSSPPPIDGDRPLPINLASALQLANARPIDIALASQRMRVAVADLERANVLWLPSIQWGTDYYRHDGRIQDTAGTITDADKSSFMVGVGPNLVVGITDAIYGPLAARQVVRARQAEVQAAANDSLLAVAQAYFDVQQARGELAGALDAGRRAADLARRAEKLAPSLVPPVEATRTRVELAARRQAVEAAREHWRVASAELARLLRMEAAALFDPVEPPHIQVSIVPLDHPVDDLIPVALTNRPELAAHQALVQAALERLRQERIRPLVPSVLLRGASTNPAGTLGAGMFGGGRNDKLNDFGARADLDVQLLWELPNLGFGYRARVDGRRAEHEVSVLQLFQTQDRVAAEVAKAHAQAVSAAAQVQQAVDELRDAMDSADKNFEGLGQTKRAGDLIVLVIRPQEAIAAVQALAQAYRHYYGAVADYNRAQFRLYRALGHPAQSLACP